MWKSLGNQFSPVSDDVRTEPVEGWRQGRWGETMGGWGVWGRKGGKATGAATPTSPWWRSDAGASLATTHYERTMENAAGYTCLPHPTPPLPFPHPALHLLHLFPCQIRPTCPMLLRDHIELRKNRSILSLRGVMTSLPTSERFGCTYYTYVRTCYTFEWKIIRRCLNFEFNGNNNMKSSRIMNSKNLMGYGWHWRSWNDTLFKILWIESFLHQEISCILKFTHVHNIRF